MANEAQIKLWNEVNAQRWLKLGDQMTRPLEVFGDLALRGLAPQARELALDVGCGTGGTTRALALRTGDAVGVDVCEPFLEIARAKGGGARYLLADAQTHRFTERFDLLYSRFGLMFFENPAAAFANLVSALRPGARKSAVVWGPWRENEWAAIPLAVLRTLMPVVDPGSGPGPFGLQDASALARLLEDAGFTRVSIERLEKPFDADAVQLADQGPAATQMRQAQASDDLRARFVEEVARALGDDMPKAVALLVTAVRP